MSVQKQAATGTDRYWKVAGDAAKYLVGQVEQSGYIRASRDYAPYKPHWIRDSSWVSIALIRYAARAKDSSPEESKDALAAASRIIKFNMGVVERSMPGLKRALSLDLGDDAFYRLENHVPARVGPDGGPFKDGSIDDTPQQGTPRSWQMQHDSIPLVLYSLREKMVRFGLDQEERQFLRRNAEVLLNYLGKVYLTECASAWEKDSHMMHAYDVGAIHGAFEFAKEFSANGVIGPSIESISRIANGLSDGGPAKFLEDHFVRGGTMYASRWPFSKEPSHTVDASQIFLFTDFRAGDAALAGLKVEDGTVAEMERALFWKDGTHNELPVRHQGDTYFTGGRWLLLGLAFADYYAGEGELRKAERITDYVIGKYRGSYPEQELRNPESPGSDEGNYLRDNGGTPIQDLAWSYAAVIIAALSIDDARRREAAKSLTRAETA